MGALAVSNTSAHGPAPRALLAALEAPPVLTLVRDRAVGDELQELEEISRTLTAHTQAPSTRLAYAKAWRSFTAFCQSHDLAMLPAHPETVRWYVAWMSTQTDQHGLPRFAVSTIRQHLAGVADHHLRAGSLDPTEHRSVNDLVRGLAKLRAERPRRKRPLVLEDVSRIIAAMEPDLYPDGVSALRDTAALWLGFVGALRRSEAAAVRLDSLELHPTDGILIHVGASKADQENVLPDVVVLPFGSSPVTCAPCALQRWIALVLVADRHRGDPTQRRSQRRETMQQLFNAQTTAHACGAEGSSALVWQSDLAQSSRLLRATYRNRHDAQIHATGVSGDALNTMLATRMSAAGMDPSAYGFHSLRAGHVTQARRNGASTEEIMRAGRWRKAETVNVYDREYNPAARNSVSRLGL